MVSAKAAACFALLSNTALAQYHLIDDYVSGGNFFSKFSFWTSSDPTHGFVQYQSQAAAQNQGLISSSNNNVYIGVDHQNVQPNGRPSVRLTSNKSYNSGLFVLDLNHMPGGICGTWPAFWTVGPNWPNDGEIDIIEGVHQQSVNAITMHTSNGCSLANTGAFTGNPISGNCYVNAAGQASNQGCTTQARNSNSYGAGFNNNGGGVYVMEWVSVAISVWFFPRGSIPSDIVNGQPTPSQWGAPLSQLYFPDGCDQSHFASQQIVFDNTFCGDWAGSVWGSSSCANLASSCNAYVANNPGAFASAYWSINSLKVYEISGQAQNFRHFTANTPANHTFVSHANLTAVPDTPDNHFVPISPHGDDAAQLSRPSS